MSELMLDRAGRRRSPATMPGFHAGRRRETRFRYPADPPYLQGIDNAELIDSVHAQRALMIPVSTSLRL
jgi:hypothetical protein